MTTKQPRQTSPDLISEKGLNVEGLDLTEYAAEEVPDQEESDLNSLEDDNGDD